MKRSIGKALAVFLTIIMLLQILPLSVIAQEYRNKKDTVEKLIENPSENNETEAKIVCEDIDKRDEHTKVFRKTDGTFTAMIYNTAVHYEENGEWKEIDNSLIRSAGKYTNKSNPFTAELPERMSGNSAVRIEKEGKSISFSLNGAQNENSEIKENENKPQYGDEKLNQCINKTEATLSYDSVYQDTDAEYTVLSNGIKENIIVKDKDAVRNSYSFDIDKGDLSYTQNSNGEILFKEGDKTVFKIPAPLMTDDAGNMSYNIEVSLTDKANGILGLTYTPSSDWTQSADRQYPICIDPAILVNDNDIFENTVLRSDYPNNGYYNSTSISISNGLTLNPDTNQIENNGASSIMLVKFDRTALQAITDSVTPTNVQLFLPGRASNLAAYEIWSSYNIETVTYATRPNIYYTPIDYYAGNANSFGLIHFDITGVFNGWINQNISNYGIEIAGYDNSKPASGSLSARAPQGATALMIDYVEACGYNENYSYQENDIFLAGKSYVNNFSRELFLDRSDLAIDGNLMPVDIHFMYNTAVYRKMGENSPYGNNWLSNYNRLVWFYEDSTGQSRLCYADEQGGVCHFLASLDNEGNPVFTDELEEYFGQSGISVSYEQPAGETGYVLSGVKIENNGNTESFDNHGRLTKIQNSSGQYIRVYYVNNTDFYKIDRITDGAGREYRFAYSDGLLQYIKCFNAAGSAIHAGSGSTTYLKVNYEYDEDSNLTVVTYPGSVKARYSYDSDGLLISASSRGLYRLDFSYTFNNRITSISEYARESSLNSYTQGNTISYIIGDGPRQITVNNTSGSIQTMQFDRHGLLSQVTDELGNIYNIQTGNSFVRTENLLLNSSFENGFASWTAETNSSPAVSTDEAYHGAKSMEFSLANNGYTVISQSVNGTQSMYTFSAYVKASENDADKKMIMAVSAFDSSDNQLAQNVRYIASIDNGFQRHILVLDAPQNTAKITVYIGIYGSSGEFLIDACQLESQSGAGEYNMLENSSFTDSTNSWSISATGNYSLVYDVLNGRLFKSLSVADTCDNAFTASQTVRVNAKEGDTLTFGALIRSETVSNSTDNTLHKLEPNFTSFADDRFAGLTVSYQYYSTDENQQTVLNTVKEERRICDYINGWQYLENTIVMQADVESVTVSFEYINHISDAKVACLSLTKTEGIPEETEETPAPEQSQTGGCSCSFCTNPECTCTCTDEELCNCPDCRKMFDVQYDEYGNIISVTICGYELSELMSVTTERTYVTGGNYLSSMKDENGNTISYDYNEDNGLLDSRTDARGNTTEYTYSTAGRLTKAETDVTGLSSGNSVYTNYGYTNGNLSSITHNGFSYYIDYDMWNNVSNIYSNVVATLTGSGQVASYLYDGNKHNQVNRVTYGNGGTVYYDHDAFGRIMGISYDGGLTNRFEYTYDSFGNIIAVRDNDTNRTVFAYGDTKSVYTDEFGLIYYSGTDEYGRKFEYSGGTLYTTEEAENSTDIQAEDMLSRISSENDDFGRLESKSIELHNLDSANPDSYTKVTSNYTYGSYTQSGETYGNGRVESILTTADFGNSNICSYNLSYEYDANGNITYEYSGTGSGRTLRYRYTYDEANQLTRVDDAVRNNTYVYVYNKGGNRVSEKIYPFTLGSNLGTATEEKTSAYTYLVWKDRLSSFNGNSISYDSAGNPTSYADKTYVWEGRNLKEISLTDGSKTQFEYDESGLRTQKRQYKTDGRLDYFVDYLWTDGKLEYQYLTLVAYISQNGQMTAHNIGPITSKVIYDESGFPQGFIVNGFAQYAFVRNLQGDVISVVDAEGQEVLQCSYDPWGNMDFHLDGTVVTNNEQALIFTALCPLTYRGYNYDFTTGLYYLQSRYYNPEWGRFINCDDTNILLATKGEPLGSNLFAYCENNPVNRVDSSGQLSKQTMRIIIKKVSILLYLFDYTTREYFVLSQYCGAGAVKILINKNDFIDKIYDCVLIDEESTYEVLAFITNYVFRERIGGYFARRNEQRSILFSDECIKKEIQLHANGYMASLGKDGIKMPKRFTVYSYRAHFISSKKRKEFIEEACQVIDIREYDVAAPVENIGFSYYSGIRECYKNTPADPYYSTILHKRIKLQPSLNGTWENYLFDYSD